MSVRIAVAGASGRMGRVIIDVIDAESNAVLAGAWEHAQSPALGSTIGNTPIEIMDGPAPLVGDIDAVIDFTTPEATLHHAAWCAQNGIPIIIGTTGLNDAHHALLDTYAMSIPLVQAPNMSIGVNVMLAVAKEAARMLGSRYDLELVETHHKHKVDAPSGTALRLLDALQSIRTEATGNFVRHGTIGARDPNEIGVQTLRGGDVVGEHTVFYFGDAERLEITHRATDRKIFAQGAVRAALWASTQAPGRYAMSDVLSS